jgi:hypothetical protein
MSTSAARWTVVLTVVAALALTGTAVAVTLPYQDCFDSAMLGTYPSSTGWLWLSQGKSGYVSNQAAYSGPQSFRLDAYPWAARMDYVTLDQVPDQLSYEVAVYVVPGGGKIGSAGFMTPASGQGVMWNCFTVDAQIGRVTFYGANAQPVDVGPYQAGQWCVLRADLDFTTSTAVLWRDGQQVAVGVPIMPKEFSSTYGYVVLNRWGVAANSYFNYGGFSNIVCFDDVALWEEPADETTTVRIDIKPGSDVNPINLNAPGVLPVVVFSSDTFDATDIDLSSVLLAGAGIATTPRGTYMAGFCDEDGDGLTDLRVHFRIQDLDRSQLADGVCWLTGATYSGGEFEGSDHVVLVPRPGR